MLRFFGFIILIFVSTSCATKNADGSCRDYTPWCAYGGHLVCYRTDDGCRQCDCVMPEKNFLGQ